MKGKLTINAKKPVFGLLLLPLLLLLSQRPLRAQPGPPPATYTGVEGRYQLRYPGAWALHPNEGAAEAAFYAPVSAGPPATGAGARLTVRPLPDQQKDRPLLAGGGPDSVERGIRRLPQAQLLHLEQRDLGAYQEVRYEYTYTAAPAPGQPRQHVVGRQIWRGGYEYRIEYRAETSQDAQYLAPGQRLVESFAFTGAPAPSRRYADQVCDDKLFAIAALRQHNGQWEDDCRTIHEFPHSDLTAPPVVHQLALPFQSYALAKGFDNCLYSVTKAPTDAPEYVYRYDPATRRGAYTSWQLPAQGDENIWISAATDGRGNLYFLTSDAALLVKVSPADGTVAVVWRSDPLRRATFYRAIAFAGAGTHGNFCIDDTNTLYEVYSTDGALLRIDLATRRPTPDLLPLDGLPQRGGYSDLLMQNDGTGRRRLYLAGPQAVFEVDLDQRRARLVRRGIYTDLAGCNLFRAALPIAPPPPLPPTTATWRGRVLDADTYQPLPQAQLRLKTAFGADKAVPLTPEGTFAVAAAPGRVLAYRAQLAGYLAADSTCTTVPGPFGQDILLQRLRVGTTLRLDNVQFEQTQATLLPGSFAALDRLAALLTDNPGLTIELRGHTDNVGDAQKNVVLSEQRVAAVKAYLVGHGVAPVRISGIGLGGAQPLAPNDQEATRRLNRRVEFRVTGMP